MEDTVLNPLLAINIIVNQLLGILVIMTHSYYFNDTLWDGEGCVDNCCDDTTQPWFYHQLNQIIQDDIEA